MPSSSATRIEGQLLVNGKILHIWVFTDGESLRAWAEEWRLEYQAEGWQDVLAGDVGAVVQ
jgi:hypothetical protein